MACEHRKAPGELRGHVPKGAASAWEGGTLYVAVPSLRRRATARGSVCCTNQQTGPQTDPSVARRNRRGRKWIRLLRGANVLLLAKLLLMQ